MRYNCRVGFSVRRFLYGLRDCCRAGRRDPCHARVCCVISNAYAQVDHDRSDPDGDSFFGSFRSAWRRDRVRTECSRRRSQCDLSVSERQSFLRMARMDYHFLRSYGIIRFAFMGRLDLGHLHFVDDLQHDIAFNVQSAVRAPRDPHLVASFADLQHPYKINRRHHQRDSCRLFRDSRTYTIP